MKRKMHAGSTSQLVPIFVYDSTKVDGSGLGSLAYNASGLVAEYRRQNQASWTAITLVAGTLGTYTPGGWIADGSLAGAYEVGLPDAALASGAGVSWVLVRFRGATNMVAVQVEIELDAVNYQSATSFVTGVNGLAPPPNWNLLAIDASGRIDLGKIAGVTTYGYLANLTGSSTATYVQFAATDAAGNAIPDDGRYAYTVWQVVSGTGINQVLALGGAHAGVARGYDVAASSMPVTCDATTQVVPLGSFNVTVASKSGQALSLPQGANLILAATAGGSSGFSATGATAGKFFDLDGTTPCIGGATDSFGNRTGVTLTPRV